MKIAEIEFNDILQSPEDCSELLNNICCERQQPYKIVGCVSNNNTLLVTFEPGQTKYKYRIAQFPAPATAELIAEIASRYTAGFSTIGSFVIDQTTWGLFAKLIDLE
jgi:hypothetical protein